MSSREKGKLQPLFEIIILQMLSLNPWGEKRQVCGNHKIILLEICAGFLYLIQQLKTQQVIFFLWFNHKNWEWEHGGEQYVTTTKHFSLYIYVATSLLWVCIRFYHLTDHSTSVFLGDQNVRVAFRKKKTQNKYNKIEKNEEKRSKASNVIELPPSLLSCGNNITIFNQFVCF